MPDTDPLDDPTPLPAPPPTGGSDPRLALLKAQTNTAKSQRAAAIATVILAVVTVGLSAATVYSAVQTAKSAEQAAKSAGQVEDLQEKLNIYLEQHRTETEALQTIAAQSTAGVDQQTRIATKPLSIVAVSDCSMEGTFGFANSTVRLQDVRRCHLLIRARNNGELPVTNPIIRVSFPDHPQLRNCDARLQAGQPSQVEKGKEAVFVAALPRCIPPEAELPSVVTARIISELSS